MSHPLNRVDCMSSGRSIEGANGGDRVDQTLRVGAFARPGVDVVAAVQAFAEAVDPAQAPARDAVDPV